MFIPPTHTPPIGEPNAATQATLPGRKAQGTSLCCSLLRFKSVAAPPSSLRKCPCRETPGKHSKPNKDHKYPQSTTRCNARSSIHMTHGLQQNKYYNYYKSTPKKRVAPLMVSTFICIPFPSKQSACVSWYNVSIFSGFYTWHTARQLIWFPFQTFPYLKQCCL